MERISFSEGPGGFELKTSVGLLTSRNLVVAAGASQHLNIPKWHGDLTRGVKRMRTRDYLNALELTKGDDVYRRKRAAGL